MKRIFIIVITLLCFINTKVEALTYPNLYSKNIIVYDLTDDEILYSKNKDSKTEIASLTKIMTTILSIEKIDNLDKKITITNEMLKGIPWDSSTAGLKVGSTYTYKDLLYGAMLPSGADATHSLAISLSGNINTFVKEMNNKAIEIGMKNTRFANVTGYDNTSAYSTASDMIILLKYALKNETFRKIFETKTYKMSNGSTIKTTINTYNKLMGLDVSKIKGSKTGNTEGAGLCMAATFDVENHELALITIKAKYVYGDFYNLKDTVSIINFVKKNYHNQSIPSKKIKNIEVLLSKEENYEVYSNDTVVFLPDDYKKEDLIIEFDGVDTLSFKNTKGEKIGVLSYKYKDKTFKEENVVLSKSLEISYTKMLKEEKGIVIFILILLIVIIGYFYLNLYLKKHRRKIKLKNFKRLFKKRK